MHRTAFAVASVVALTTPFASAQITEQDDPVFGLGSLTRDAAQNLDFLDVTFSTNRSFDDVSSQFGVGGDFEGWRYATEQEVLGLLNNWGFSPNLEPFGPDVTSASVFSNGMSQDIRALVELLGVTIDNTLEDSIATFGATSSFGTGGRRRGIFINATPDGQPDEVRGTSIRNDRVSSLQGHYLVRAVPAPGAFALFAGAGLVASRRRR